MVHDEPKMEELSGRGISSGLGLGKAFAYQDILQRDLENYDIEPEQIEAEYTRLQNAIRVVQRDLESASEAVAGSGNAELSGIFQAHQMMLADPVIQDDIKKELESELINAEQVVKHVFRKWQRKLRSSNAETPGRPGDDVADIGRRLLRHLAGLQAHVLEDLPEGSVVIAKRLLPSDTVFLSRQATEAVVLEFAGPLSHAALLTRELGVPAVSEIPQVLDRIATGDTLLVDGQAGLVVVHPTPLTLAAFRERLARQNADRYSDRETCHDPARSTDGIEYEVMANVSCREDVMHALENGADGVGLYRVEGIYLARHIPPTEDELIQHLRESLKSMADKPITVRLLDAGGDKELPFLNLPTEPNPFLGLRGIRLLLAYPELLDTQLRALLRLSADFPIRILVPMVTLSEEMISVREKLQALADEAGHPVPPLGAMIETPAAALCAADIANQSDFLSIGTNDLTQYTMVAGRENPTVSKYFVDDHPAIRQLIKLTAESAVDIAVSICGELASRQEGLLIAAENKIRSLSVAPPLIPEVKAMIRALPA